MLQFADEFPEQKNVVTLSRHLSWSHFLALLPLKTEEQRLFYAQQAIHEQMRDLPDRELYVNQCLCLIHLI